MPVQEIARESLSGAFLNKSKETPVGKNVIFIIGFIDKGIECENRITS
jgi:hypothetical protein